MKKITLTRSLILVAATLLLSASAQAQFTFTNSNSSLPFLTYSGNAVTVVDVNNDGLDDMLIMDQGYFLILQLQQQDGTYTRDSLGSYIGAWGMSAADVDHNGWKDVAVGGYGAIFLVKLFSNGGMVTYSSVILGGSYFVQNITFGDFNNDGWVDLFVCDDDDFPKVYRNTAGVLNFDFSLMVTNIYSGYDSGNYGSVWTDFDNDGDLDMYVAHCRQGVNSNGDLRRKDRLFVNNGSNVYTDQAGAYGIETFDYKQTWTTSFGDLDNDGDLDIVKTNHGEPSQILQNDGTGHYTDITGMTGFNVFADPLESTVEDFDNDGFLDILVSGYMMYFYHNNGNGTFSLVSGNAAVNYGMLSFATGDLNHDGKTDMYTSYGQAYNNPTNNPDILYLNSTVNNNHFITFDLIGTVSDSNAIGARITIYGAWGKQIREIHAGDSYGTSNSMQMHFGLGTNTTIDSARIDWPSHLHSYFYNLQADQFVTAVEGGCTITGNIIQGPFVLCTGQTRTLTAPPGFSSYLWSNGATTPSINVSAVGYYNVKVTNAAGCSNISPTVHVIPPSNETPLVTTTGTSLPCEGTVTLTSSPASAYLWTGPNNFTATTASIHPPETGTYIVTITGICGNYTSAPDSVNVLSNPAPVGTGATGTGPTSLTLYASAPGALSWYDSISGGTLLTTGTTYTTPVINTTTDYYVDATTTYSGAVANVGQPYHIGSNFYNDYLTNGQMFFDVLVPCTLQSVKVYTDSVGVRKIELRDNSGTVLHSLLINLPADTTVVSLNWPLTPGTTFRLTTNDSVNAANFGNNNINPYLWRSNSSAAYPYTINNELSITGSSQGLPYYYYFYDWVVQAAPVVCTSPRVPVTATITTVTGVSDMLSGTIKGYPNPAQNEFILDVASLKGNVTLELYDVLSHKIVQQKYTLPGGKSSLKINLEEFENGVYFVRLVGENADVLWKQSVVKQ